MNQNSKVSQESQPFLDTIASLSAITKGHPLTKSGKPISRIHAWGILIATLAYGDMSQHHPNDGALQGMLMQVLEKNPKVQGISRTQVREKSFSLLTETSRREAKTLLDTYGLKTVIIAVTAVKQLKIKHEETEFDWKLDALSRAFDLLITSQSSRSEKPTHAR